MYTGRTYKISEFLFWTRRNLLWLLLISSIPVFCYDILGLKWLVVPWPIVAFLGTATAFVIGFKNQQTYNRTWEARDIWGMTMGMSRSWTMMCRDFIKDKECSAEIINRHMGWITCLRYEMRSQRPWENINKSYNREYAKFYEIPEKERSLKSHMQQYISDEEFETIISTSNPAVQIISIQGTALTDLFEQGSIENSRFLELHKYLREFTTQQIKCEKIKDFPYPRQHATVNRIFVWLFCLLLPFAMLKEFSALNELASGIFKGHMVWFVVPFSMIISWVYTSLDQVGESTENPFEGGPNDVPISQMCLNLELDVKKIMGQYKTENPVTQNNIIVL